MFAALRFRNFRLLWIGLIVSFAGSFMQQAALLWHVSLLVPPEDKGLALGFVGLVRAGPIIAFSLVAGVAADVFDRRRLMFFTAAGGALVAGGLAMLAWRGTSAVWAIYALAAIGAGAGAFDPPARHAMLAMLVPREHLPSAVNLNTAMMQTTSVIGPAIGGLLIAQGGVAWAYLANAVSFLFIIGMLLLMRDVPKLDRSMAHARDDFSVSAAREGLRFVFRSPIMRSTMLIDFFATFFASAMALLPIFAQDVLRVDARGYGVLTAAPAVGAVIATLFMLPLTPHIRRQGVVLVGAIMVYGAATIVFGLSRSFALTFCCLALIGAGDSVSTMIRHLVRQLETPDAIRGRMVGVNMMFFMGGPQLGELESGVVAQWLGATISVISGGFGCLIATAAIATMTPQLWNYRAKRISDQD